MINKLQSQLVATAERQDDPICPVGGNVSQLPILNGWMRTGNQNNHHSSHPIWTWLQEVHTRPAKPQNRMEAPTAHWKDGGGCWGPRVLTGATDPLDTVHLLVVVVCVCVWVCKCVCTCVHVYMCMFLCVYKVQRCKSKSQIYILHLRMNQGVSQPRQIKRRSPVVYWYGSRYFWITRQKQNNWLIMLHFILTLLPSYILWAFFHENV